MSALFLRKSFFLGFLCLFLLTAAVLLRVPVVNSARDDSPVEFVIQTQTDNVFSLSITTNDIIYNPQDQMIYATRPSSVGNDGNSISRINPLTGEVVGSVYVGSEPGKLAISDNGQTLYVTLDGAYAIRRYETSTQTPGVQFPIGRETTSSNPYGPPHGVSDIAVAPGNPNLVAVARVRPGISPPGAGVAIYNNGVRLPNTGPSHSAASNYLVFSPSAATLYGGGYDEGLRTMTINENGVTDNTGNGTPFAVKALKYENNLIFTSTGQIINPATRTLLGTNFGINTTAFVPVTESGRVLYAAKDGSSSNITIKAFDINTFIQIGSLTIPNTGNGDPTTLVRYGTNGLAMRTWDNKIYFIQTSLIPTGNPLPTPSSTPTSTPTPTPTVYSKFIRPVTLPNKDLIYSRTEQKFYASVPSTAGPAVANSVTRINPATGAIENSVVVGTNPGRLALSDNGQTLYVGINGANAVRKFDMQTQTPGLQFPLGNGVNGPKTAYDIDILPDNPNAVVVSYGTSSYNYDGADIYDDGVKRAQKANASGAINIASPDTLYVGENWLYKYSINQNGLSLQGSSITSNNYGETVLIGNLLYTSSGGVLDLSTNEFKGSFTGVGYWAGLMVDAPNNRIYYLVNESTGTPSWVIKAYRLDNFLPVGSIPLPGISIYVPYAESPHRLFRWGENGLAFNDNNDKIYFIQTNLVSTEGSIPTGVLLGSQTYNGYESSSSSSIQVMVTRTGDLTATTTVNYATADATATAGQDFTATSGTLTFLPGESSKTVSISIINDNIFEGTETFNFVLSDPAGPSPVELLDPGTATLTISDNDSQPYASTSNTTVNEPRITGTTTALFTVQFSNATTQTATVDFATADGTATAGSDYVATSGTLTFTPLETTKTIAVQILADDNYNEPNETFKITLSNGVNVSLGISQVTATIVNYNPQTAPHVRFDFDGDGKSDISIFRPDAGEWWYLQSSDNQNRAFQFGSSTDRIVPADYTGDGKTDIAFFRPSTGQWFIMRSENLTFYAAPFGSGSDTPAPADYDGDGKADLAVFRSSDGNWYILRSSGGVAIIPFGGSGDAPVAGDYDGDGKADLAIWRQSAGEWWINRSSLGVTALQFGSSTDKAVPADFTGDGKTDVAFFRPSSAEWFILRSENLTYYAAPFGSSADVPAPADYDGDGKADLAVFRATEANWYILKTTGGVSISRFGSANDRPVPGAFVP